MCEHALTNSISSGDCILLRRTFEGKGCGLSLDPCGGATAWLKGDSLSESKADVVFAAASVDVLEGGAIA